MTEKSFTIQEKISPGVYPEALEGVEMTCREFLLGCCFEDGEHFFHTMRIREVAMISQSCDVKEFIEAIRDRDYLEVIYLADKEATEAERLKYRFKATKRAEREYCPRYADVLKSFIFFLRYGVKNRLIGKRDFDLFRSLRESLLERMQPESESIN